MYLRDVPLGARAVFYLDRYNNLCGHSTDKTMLAWVYAKQRGNATSSIVDDRRIVLIGWKENDFIRSGAAFERTLNDRNRELCFNDEHEGELEYSHNAKEIHWGYIGEVIWWVKSFELPDSEIAVPVIASKQEIADWEFFKRNVSGECSCGIQRSECPFHRE